MTLETDWLEMDVNGQTARPTAQQLADKTKALSPEAIAENGRTNKAKRNSLKSQIAEAMIAELEHSRLNRVYEVDIPAAKEILAAEHCSAAAPFQARLREIKAAQIALIVEQQPSDPALEAERIELQNTIDAMNADLRAAIAHKDAIAAEVYTQRQTAGSKAIRSLLETELVHLASPALLTAMAVAESSARWAEARFNRATERSDSWGRQHDKRTSFNIAEHNFAAAEVERTKQILAAAHQACLDE